MSIEALSYPRAERPSVPSSYTTWMVALCCLSLISTSLEAYVSGIRYTSYAVLPAFFAISLIYGLQFRIPVRLRIGSAAFMVASAVMLSTLSGSASDTVSMLVFTALPLCAGALLGPVQVAHLKMLLATCIVGMAIEATHKGIGSLNLLDSSGIVESSLSFPLLAISLSLMLGRVRRYRWVALLGLVASSKRVSMVGYVVAFSAAQLFRFKVVRALTDTAAKRFLCVLVIFMLGDTVAAQANNVAFVVTRALPAIFPSPESLLLGRYGFNATMTTYMANNASWVNEIIGFGAGSLRSQIGPYFFAGIQGFLLHNDYLFVRFEYGWLGQLLIFGAFALVFCRSRAAMVLAVAQAILFATDNTLIYTFHILTLLVCERYLSAIDIGRDRNAERRPPPRKIPLLN